jgi:glucokinase
MRLSETDSGLLPSPVRSLKLVFAVYITSPFSGRFLLALSEVSFAQSFEVHGRATIMICLPL